MEKLSTITMSFTGKQEDLEKFVSAIHIPETISKKNWNKKGKTGKRTKSSDVNIDCPVIK